MNGLKKTIILLIVCAFLIGYPLSNFSAVINENYTVQVSTDEGVSFINKMEQLDISEAESFVNEAEKIRNYVSDTSSARVAQILYKLETG